MHGAPYFIPHKEFISIFHYSKAILGTESIAYVRHEKENPKQVAEMYVRRRHPGLIKSLQAIPVSTSREIDSMLNFYLYGSK